MELIIAIAVIWLVFRMLGNSSHKPPPAPQVNPREELPPSRSYIPTSTTPARPSLTAASFQPTAPRMPSDTTVFTHVAGAPHRIGKNTPVETVFHTGQSLTAERERGNRHDSNAIKLNIGQRHVGYIPKEVNAPLAEHMDYGGSLSVRVTRVNSDDRWLGVRIAVTRD
jgi:hypothetical protein